MKKKILWISLLAILVCVAVCGVIYFNHTYIVIDAQVYQRDREELDLSGAPVEDVEKIAELHSLRKLDLRDTQITAEEYGMLCQALPDCEILWSIPFQDSYQDMDLTALKLDRCTDQDLDALALFAKLETVDATACADLEMIMRLKERYPNLAVHYNVPLGDAVYREDTRELILDQVDSAQMETALRCLPELEKVVLTGAVPDNDTVLNWVTQYPDVVFQWFFEVCGVPVSSLDTKLILNEIPMESVEEVESSLKYFRDLQVVEMCDCGIPSEEMDALWKRHPETRFVWTVNVGKCKLRTDVTVFMPYQFGYDGFSKLRDEHTAELKYCVDIICMDVGHMAISDYSFLAYMPHMQYLILADTQGTDFSVLAQLHELKFLEIFMTSFDQAEILTGLTSLEDLNIGTSALDNIEPLLEMTWLKRLWLPGNVNISYEERIQLRKGLPDTVVFFNSAGSTGGGWRECPNYFAMRDLLDMWYSEGW